MSSLPIPLILFMLGICITPGPNNIMLSASGANFGFTRTLPHILGIVVGMLLLYVLAIFGLATLYQSIPIAQLVLKTAGILYLLHTASKLFRSSLLPEQGLSLEPMNFWKALGFQFLNPKALMICFSTITAFAKPGEDFFQSAILVLLVFLIVCPICISVWTGAGMLIKRRLKTPIQVRIMNCTLGILILSSIGMIL